MPPFYFLLPRQCPCGCDSPVLVGRDTELAGRYTDVPPVPRPVLGGHLYIHGNLCFLALVPKGKLLLYVLTTTLLLFTLLALMLFRS